MLSIRDNFEEVVHGGNPDRYVKQYEPFSLIFPRLRSGEAHDPHYIVDNWGVYMQTVPNQPGKFPVHDMEHRVVKDIADWKKYVTFPKRLDKEEFWAPYIAQAQEVDRTQQFVTFSAVPGVFERVHHLCEIVETLAAFYEEPEALKELLAFITEWELHYAECAVKYVKPEALFHHDDWGTKDSTFLSLDTWREFIKPCYEKIYGFYKDNGVKYIVHHSDSFGATLVPDMIDLGIDVWQGCLRTTNDLPTLVEQYGDKLTFMGAIETANVDIPSWTPKLVEEEVNTAIDFVHSKTGFIPCQTQGANDASYPGVYEAINSEIDKRSAKDFA